MKFALMTTMIAFLAFAALIVWFRYYVERIAQKIAVIHVQKMGVLASVVLPAVLFLQLRERPKPRNGSRTESRGWPAELP
jgi:cell division protein FtsX